MIIVPSCVIMSLNFYISKKNVFNHCVTVILKTILKVNNMLMMHTVYVLIHNLEKVALSKNNTIIK